MDKIKEIGKVFDILVCIDDATVENTVLSDISPVFKNIARTVPSLVKKRMQGHAFSLLIIDDALVLDDTVQNSIKMIQHNFPKTPILALCESENHLRLQTLLALNIDRVVGLPLDAKGVLYAIQRELSSAFEVYQTTVYESKLENIITGQNRKLDTQQMRDTLTGLKNGLALKDSFDSKTDKGLIFLDVDNFDSINTLYGLQMGDNVLRYISKRMEKFLPKNADLYRISADEFAVVVENPKEKQIKILSQQIVAMFVEAPIVVGNIHFDISFSSGFSLGKSYDIFNNAKLANLEAKYLGGQTSVAFDEKSGFLEKQKENHIWVNEIKNALKEDRIEVYYQPMYNTKKSKITKYEALVRLRNSEGNIITPLFFIKPAVMAQLITDISRVVIDKTFKTFTKTNYDFSINLTDQDFNENYLENYLKYKCSYYNIDPSRVYIEILEEMSLNDSGDFLAQVKRLKKHGFNISIDDFGVEKSNYSRVIDLEAEIIKIDGSFIRTIDENKNSQIIVESIVSFAQKIGAKTVAEFVETQTTFDRLKDLGVDYAQGYLIGKAEPMLIDPLVSLPMR